LHSQLMSAIEERIVDRQMLKLLRAMLRAGVMEDQAVTRRQSSGYSDTERTNADAGKSPRGSDQPPALRGSGQPPLRTSRYSDSDLTTPSHRADFGHEVDAHTRDRPSPRCQKNCNRSVPGASGERWERVASVVGDE
jgi:hypothetical protein